MTFTQEINKPNVNRILTGFRSTGHNIGSAISDLVDNSITHGEATKIAISMNILFDGQVRVSVLDNGVGMNKEQLFNALKYGTEKKYEKKSLGKYGLGLKTASTAFCKKVVVISRAKRGETVNIVFNDLDEMEKAGDWITNCGDEEDIDPIDLEVLNDYNNSGSGTLVIWDKVDKMISTYQKPKGRHALNAIGKKCDEVEATCVLLFHKFLDPSFKDARNIEITVNGKKIEPWDPYLKGLSIIVQKEEFEIENQDGSNLGSFNCVGYRIPRKTEIPADSDKTFVPLGVKNSIVYQGFYVYRNHRVIYFGDWLRTGTPELHLNYARIELCFDEALDEYFNLDFSKRNVELNVHVFDEVQKWAAGVRAASSEYSRQGKNKMVQQAANAENSPHASSNRSIQEQAHRIEKRDTRFDISSDAENQATLHNQKGSTVITVGISNPQNPNEVKVIRCDRLPRGDLWEPHLIPLDNETQGGTRGVKINTSHPFYQKVYYPNFNNSKLIEALDAVFYSLAITEHEVTSEVNKEEMEDYRSDVSRALDRLVRHMEEPEEDDT